METWRTIFIGDIHWCYKELKLLLKKLNLTLEDKVYLTWDIISKWPKSYKVLKYIYKNNKQFKTVLWNNDLLFINRVKWKIKNPYKWFNLEKLKNKIEKHPELLDFLESLPSYIESEDFLLTHWWIIANKNIDEHSVDELTKIRDLNWIPWYSLYKWKKKIIYWHRWYDWLRIRKNTIWLDTACVYWKRLTAYILETWEIYQQTALDIYINLYEDENQ